MKRWYVVHTRPTGELRATLNLERQGFKTYLVRYLKERRHARKVERILQPLFPRYVFVSLDMDVDPWRSILGTFGVDYLVSNGDWPTPVPEGIVEDIRSHENELGFIILSPNRLKPGQKVQIVEGPFAMQTALFQCATDNERAVFLLQILGRQVRATMAYSSVAAA